MINNPKEVLDENGQVIRNQAHQTPLNIRSNQTPGIRRGTQERGQNPLNVRGAPLRQPIIPQNHTHQQHPQFVQPIYYDPYYIAPPQPYNQHINPSLAPLPNGHFEEPEPIQQNQQVPLVDPNARAIADFMRPVVQPYLR